MGVCAGEGQQATDLGHADDDCRARREATDDAVREEVAEEAEA